MARKPWTDEGKEIKRWMKQYGDSQKYLKRRERVIESIRLDAEGSALSAPDLSKERVKSSLPLQASFEDEAIRIADAEEKLNSLRTASEKLKQQIINVINQEMDDERNLLLKYKYIYGKTYDEIGKMVKSDECSGRGSTVFSWEIDSFNHFKMPDAPIWLNY